MGRTRMLPSLLIAALLGLSWLVSATPTLAASFTVNSTADTVDANPGNGICADSNGKCTLRAAIMEANGHGGADTISVPAGTYTLTRAGTGEDTGATGDLDITTGSLTIAGAGAATIIDAGATNDRVFDILAATPDQRPIVTMSGATIRKGKGGSGDQGGGGIRALAGTLTLSNVTLTQNTSANYGGAILYTNSSLFLPFSGGSRLGILTLNNVILNGNSADAAGGAVYLGQGASMRMTNSQVKLNNVTGTNIESVGRDGGGGIFVMGGGVSDGNPVTSALTIANSAFDQNHAADDDTATGGGALYMTAGPTTATISGGTFTANQVLAGPQGFIGNGGAIASDNVALTIDGTTFDGNQAVSSDGGAIYAHSGTVAISNAHFTHNASTNSEPLTSHGGGAVLADGSGSFSLTNSTVSNNSSIIAGGGLSFKDETATLTGVTISGNQVTQQIGGGIYITGQGDGPVRVIGSTISNNHAFTNGGGIENAQGGMLHISDSQISGNTADRGGGIDNYISFSLYVTNTAILSNTADSVGGGVYSRHDTTISVGRPVPPTPSFTNVTIGGNAANSVTDGGGGIYNDQTTIRLANTTVSNNTALNGGGIVSNHNPTPDYPLGLDLTNVTISGNQAVDSGGGLYELQGTATLNNVTIANNSAVGGGGVYDDPTNSPALTIKNTIVASNSGTTGPDCATGAGSITSADYNLIGSASGCTIGGATTHNRSGDPKLGLLADNGGPTRTQALLASSPAINNGNPAVGSCAPKDQRGAIRVGACDIGAYELVPNQADLSISVTDSPDPVAKGAVLTYTVHVSNAGPAPSQAVTAIVNLPAAVTFKSATGSGWACGRNGTVVTCTRSGLSLIAAAPIAVVVTAPSSGTTLSGSATVSSGTPDPSTGNNSASFSTTLSGGGGGGGSKYKIYLPLIRK